MRHRYRLYVALGACVSAAIALSAASPADAAALRGWHLTDFSDVCSQTPYKVAATSADSAWMLGGGFPDGGQCPPDGIDVNHWNGTGWTLLPPTTAVVGQTGFDVALAASSAHNVWVFPLIGPGTGNEVYASSENWDGSAWTSFSMPYRMNLSYTVAFSRSDAWAFGPRAVASGIHVGVHFNGISWQRAPLPGEPLAVSAQAPNDIWAVGPSAGTAARAPDKQVRIAMHWDGKRWQTLSTPRIRVPKGDQVLVNGAVAIGPMNFWWSYAIVTARAQTRLRGGQMLHWNGRKWSEVKLPDSAALPPAQVAAQDGAGGVWLTSTAGDSSAPVTLAYHYSAAGRWSRYRLPIPAGFNSTALNLFWIPHTRSLWAVGSARNSSTSVVEGIVERYYAP